MAIQKYQAFLKVVELGSITRAAEALGYTQSAVSRMVADLEEEWQLNLLNRSRGGLSLSSDGIMMLPYIKDLCERHEALQEEANSLKGLDTGFIRIGTFSSVSTQVLPSILKTFNTRYPHIGFQLITMDHIEVEAALCSGEIDCGFISVPATDKVDSSFLMRDRMVAVLPPEHPLNDELAYPLQQFCNEPYIKLTDEHPNEVSMVVEKLNTMLVAPLKVLCEVNDDYSVMAMVESGLGVSILPELVTARMPFNVCLKEFDPPQYRDISIAVKKGRHPSPATEKFIQVVKEYFRTM